MIRSGKSHILGDMMRAQLKDEKEREEIERAIHFKEAEQRDHLIKERDRIGERISKLEAQEIAAATAAQAQSELAAEALDWMKVFVHLTQVMKMDDAAAIARINRYKQTEPEDREDYLMEVLTSSKLPDPVKPKKSKPPKRPESFGSWA